MLSAGWTVIPRGLHDALVSGVLVPPALLPHMFPTELDVLARWSLLQSAAQTLNFLFAVQNSGQFWETVPVNE